MSGIKWVRRTVWVAALAFWALMYVVTHLPPDQVPKHPPVGDKVQHFTAYLLWSLLSGAALWASFPTRRGLPLVLLVVGAAYGAADEATQPLVGRFAEWGDWLADVAGVTTGAVALGAARWLVRRRGARGTVSGRSYAGAGA